MRAVARVASGLLRCSSYDELDGVIISACAEVLPYDAFTFALYLPDEHALRFLDGWDGDVFESGATIPLAGTPSELVIRERRPLLQRQADPATPPGVVLFGSGRRSESIIRVPVIGEDRVLGVMSVQSYTPCAYDEADVEVLQVFAAVAATAMQNIELLREQRSMRAALAESEAKFRAVVDNMAEGILITDLDDVILYTNQRNCEITGYSMAELVGSNAAELLVAPEYRDLARSQHAGRQAGRSTRYTVQEVRSDGGRIWIEIAGSPLYGADGRLTGTVAVISDITDRKGAEDALRGHAAALAESEDRFRQVVDNIREAFWLFDYGAGRLLYVSRGFERIWGRPVEDLYRDSRAWRRHVHPEDRATVRNALQRARDVGYDIEYRVLRPDGEQRWVRDRAFPITDEAGTVVRLVGFAEDVTEERRRESQLRRAERLAAVGTLIGGVAHELNNPLQAIRGFTDLLLEAGASGEDRDALETIGREARRAAAIVAELRLLARRSHDEGGHRQPVDLNDVVCHVLRTRAYSLAADNIDVRQDLAAELPMVPGDAAQLEQVVLNLIVNAAQALAQVDRARQLIVRTRRGPTVCTLTVHDNGPGIETGHLARLFDPFWTTKAPGEGTGLGLSVVHNIISDHGGTVHVESEVGSGTTFRIELPLAADRAADTSVPADASPVHPSPAAAAPRRSLRLLVVDDEDALRAMMARFGARRGHRVDVASDGAAALSLIEAAAAEEPYDVILSDLHMPGMSGRQLAEKLLDLDPGYEDRLLLLTGAVETPDIAWIRDRTGLTILHKPFSLPDLLKVLEPFEQAAGVAAGGA